MPSQLPVPTIEELLDVAGKAMEGLHDPTDDTREGSVHELLYGPVAMLLSAQVIRDRDMARAAYFDAAEGSDLTGLIEDKLGVKRILDAYGNGVARFQRASAAAGGGTIWKGTRVVAWSASADPQTYEVATDTPVGASDLIADNVPIKATQFGESTRTDAITGVVLDPLWDSTFTITKLTCVAGTAFEKADAYRARARKIRRDSRVGYIRSMQDALILIGAVDVVFFASDYAFGSVGDVGTNVCYVGDAGGNASTTLLNAAKLSLESTRMLGADLMVLPMTSSPYVFTGTANLWQDPGGVDQRALSTAILGRIRQYVASTYVPKRDGVKGSILKADPNLIEDVTVTLPSSDSTLSPAAWPAVLTRFKFDPTLVNLTFAGPV